MLIVLLHFLLYLIVADGVHFNGGTIRWQPMNPYVNSSSVPIAIIQSYSWTYPTITCASNVPISTSGRSGANTNLTCISSCSTDGGYATKPVNILTDCVSASSSLGMMSSTRSVNMSLTSGAHFYLSFQGSSWTALNDPPVGGLYWSIVTFIDLRMRSDGFINTPPEATVVSPQYAVVNQTTQIQIPVSDVNAGDDIRCRWSVYTAGNRKRRQEHVHEGFYNALTINVYKKLPADREIVHIRKKRKTDPCTTSYCSSTCKDKCPCRCSSCTDTTCSGTSCKAPGSYCPRVTTTVETPGTVPPTSSYANHQPIDECGGICYPSSVPSGTTLSNCTLSFKGLVPDRWYAVAIQQQLPRPPPQQQQQQQQKPQLQPLRLLQLHQLRRQLQLPRPQQQPQLQLPQQLRIQLPQQPQLQLPQQPQLQLPQQPRIQPQQQPQLQLPQQLRIQPQQQPQLQLQQQLRVRLQQQPQLQLQQHPQLQLQQRPRQQLQQHPQAQHQQQLRALQHSVKQQGAYLPM
ncbi:unnamed protein product [Rotaria sp. Silwood2]|nr:unnamed protein product [Rotaria sp. Silwood2]